MDKGRWIVRAASLTILLGFFLPAMLVSCSGGFVNTSHSFSLADLANQAKQPLLYLLPIAVIAAGILTFLREETTFQQNLYLWIELGVVVVGLISIVGSLLDINSQLQNGTYGLFNVSLDYGAFFLIAGFIAFGVGWSMQWQMLGSPKLDFKVIVQPVDFPHAQEYPPIQSPSRADPSKGRPGVNPPSLELIEGNLPTRRIFFQSDEFAIGRSSENQLRLPDPTVSRVHARLRLAQGMWFIQDQKSSGGTVVNGELTDATRLEEGDEIKIGSYRFIFHA